MRTLLDKELVKVRKNILLLGAQANQATARAVAALIHRDFQQAREVKRDDRSTDQLRYEVENACMSLMATQQPVARDLRELTALALIAVELERCGDYAKGIAKAARRISRANGDISSFNLGEMDTYARRMLDRAVSALIQVDVQAAQAVTRDDAQMDQLYHHLLASVMADITQNAAHIESGAWLLHAGHCLERLADRATTVADRVLYVETGALIIDAKVHHQPGAISESWQAGGATWQ